ncbi:MAG TPA: acetolactate synthase large subunit [Phycisphaerales bacterium]|nr:acetolactate synthase large subunit [Phycisphaerales bacterium]
MTGAELFVECLKSEGVERIFGVPGEENLQVLDALAHSGIELVVTRHEQAAAFMAATFGRLTGKAGVCLSTLGPGATNLLTGVAYANLGAMPLVAITGQKPIRESKQGRFQILDIVDMMQPVTKMSRQLDGADMIAASVREAFRTAQSERPGATHLELPEDIAEEETRKTPLPASLSRRPLVEEKALNAAVDCLRQAKRPLLIIGAGANRKKTCQSLSRLVSQRALFFSNTQMGKGVVSEDSPYFVGTCAWSSGDYVHQAVEEADVILLVGHDVVEKPPFFMERGGREIIHLNYVEASVDPVYFPQLELVGDIADAVDRLNQALSGHGGWDQTIFQKARDRTRESVAQQAVKVDFPIHPARLVADLRSLLGPDDVVALDNGLYKLWFARNYRAQRSNSLLLDNALASMGAGLPSALAAKLVKPQSAVVSVCGDGGFFMNSPELETAVRLKLDLVVLVLRDDALGMIKAKQKDMGFQDYGLDIGNPDLVKYAEAYGARGTRVESVESFRSIVKEALEAGGVWVVDVPIHYDDTAKPILS